jgi:uncharacterized protein YjbI with pentapeptide repeats
MRLPSRLRLGSVLVVSQKSIPMKIHDTKETLLVTNADLSGSSFTDVNLREAQFTGVNLSKPG